MIILGAAVLVAVAIAITAFVRGEGTRKTVNRIDQIVQSPCQRDATSKACQQLKIESDKARSPRSACVITRLAGYPGCPALDGRRAAVAAHAGAGQGAGVNEETSSQSGASVPETVAPTDTSPPTGGAPPSGGSGDTGHEGGGASGGTGPGGAGGGMTTDQGLVGDVTDDVAHTVQDLGDNLDQVTCQAAPITCP